MEINCELLIMNGELGLASLTVFSDWVLGFRDASLGEVLLAVRVDAGESPALPADGASIVE